MGETSNLRVYYVRRTTNVDSVIGPVTRTKSESKREIFLHQNLIVCNGVFTIAFTQSDQSLNGQNDISDIWGIQQDTYIRS